MNVSEKKEILLQFKEQKRGRLNAPEVKGLEQNVRAAIAGLEDGKQRKAMLFRYIDAMSVEQAAECMDLSPRQVIRITNQAMEELEL